MEGLVEDARFLDVALSLKAKEKLAGLVLAVCSLDLDPEYNPMDRIQGEDQMIPSTCLNKRPFLSPPKPRHCLSEAPSNHSTLDTTVKSFETTATMEYSAHSRTSRPLFSTVPGHLCASLHQNASVC